MNKNDQWLTPEAKDALDAWLQRHQITWSAQGAEPSEIRSDLESHLYHEREGDELVPVERVRSAIDSMGLPSMNVEIAPMVPLEKRDGCIKICVDWFFGLLANPRFLAAWALMVVILELGAKTLSGMFFDPMARTGQVIVLVATVILGVVAVMPRFEKAPPAWLVFLRGAGAVIAAYWGVMLLPVLVMGTLGYVVSVIGTLGIGLLIFPIFMLCVMIAAAPLCSMFGFLKADDYGVFRSTGYLGMLLGLLILVFVEGPSYLTRYGVANDNPALIRSLGSTETLLAMCSEGGSKLDTTGYITGLHKSSFMGGRATRFTRGDEISKRREIYYRVTGKAFNASSAESSWETIGRRGRGGVNWDDDLGGDSVSARVAGLDLAGSRLDAHVDAASRLGYFEWTMDFSNSSPRNQEARMQLLLPSGGVVSRLTLWVNGEPEEAAFSSTEKVTKAYKQVAVVQRRDPVLVRWVGTDRVMVQCFPVLTTENMRIRIGVTAPVDESGRLFLPRLIEQNFGMKKELETTVWLQGDTEMSMDGLTAKGESGKWRETHGAISALDLAKRHSHVKCVLSDELPLVWTEDQFAKPEQRFLQRERLDDSASQRGKKVVVVVDGSSYLNDWVEAADEAIGCLRNHGHKVKVILAHAEDQFLTEEPLVSFNHQGGQNCIAALRLGLSEAQEMKADHLIWFHGSQPVTFGEEEGFLQLLERGFFQVKFGTVDLAGGPNRLVEIVSRRVDMSGSARPSGPDDLMASLLGLLQKSEAQYQWIRQAEEPTEGKKVWDHMARHRTWELVQAASRSGKKRSELAKLAANYQLVTPVSGAVVLETAEQYKRFGLEQADLETTPEIPGVPEPSTVLLSILSTLMVWRRRRTKF